MVPFGVACRRSLAEHLEPADIFEITKQGFDYYIEHFDQPYPFAKYDQVFVPEFNIGAMENVGCVTFTEAFVFRSKTTDATPSSRAAEVILHELAHMWFGDLVTMRWWDDLWLNESFATYLAARCLAEATRLPRRLDDVRQRRQDVGAPAGRAAVDASDRRRHPRPRRRRAELRRHHVRQGRLGA